MKISSEKKYLRSLRRVTASFLTFVASIVFTEVSKSQIVPRLAPPPGYKIFVAEKPIADDGSEKPAQASIRFFIKMSTDTCNRVQIQGAIEEHSLPTNSIVIVTLAIGPESITRTLKNCLKRERVDRAVEITTPLAEPFLLEDNLIIYLPQHVDATVEYAPTKP